MVSRDKKILGQSINIIDCLFYLMPEGAVYWPEDKALIIADLHLGKVTHFRKAGIAVPLEAKNSNWRALNNVIEACNPKKVIFLGDLFHSHYNAEWKELLNLMDTYTDLEFRLVVGNHDILDLEIYKDSPLILSEEYIKKSFVMTHHPLDEIECGSFNFCGHIHPSIRLTGQALQSVKLSCYYLTDNQMILPAFGTFTGTKNLDIEAASRIYGIVEGEIIKIK